MGGGPDSCCVDRVYGADGVVHGIMLYCIVLYWIVLFITNDIQINMFLIYQ